MTGTQIAVFGGSGFALLATGWSMSAAAARRRRAATAVSAPEVAPWGDEPFDGF